MMRWKLWWFVVGKIRLAGDGHPVMVAMGRKYHPAWRAPVVWLAWFVDLLPHYLMSLGMEQVERAVKKACLMSYRMERCSRGAPRHPYDSVLIEEPPQP